MITWDQFRLRFANFLGFITGNGESVIKNIKMKTLTDSKKIIKSTKIIAPERNSESYIVRKDTPKVIKKQFLKVKREQSPQRVQYEKPNEMRSWISPYLNEYFEDLVAIFQQIDSRNQGMIDANELKDLLRAVLNIMKVSKDKDLFLFDRMIENRFKLIQPNSKTSYSKVTLYNAVEIIEEWAAKESFNRLSFPDQLKNSVKEYEDLLQQFLDEDMKELKDLIASFKIIHENFVDLNSNVDLHREKQIKGLKFIFSFYARQTQMHGKSPTFEELTKVNNIWNIGKFFKFCTDFGLLGKQINSRRLSKSELNQIFQVSAENSLNMNEPAFMVTYI